MLYATRSPQRPAVCSFPEPKVSSLSLLILWLSELLIFPCYTHLWLSVILSYFPIKILYALLFSVIRAASRARLVPPQFDKLLCVLWRSVTVESGTVTAYDASRATANRHSPSCPHTPSTDWTACHTVRQNSRCGWDLPTTQLRLCIVYVKCGSPHRQLWRPITPDCHWSFRHCTNFLHSPIPPDIAITTDDNGNVVSIRN